MLLLPFMGFCQSAEDSIKITVNRLFEAMITSDGGKVSGTFSESAVLQTITSDENGSALVKNEKVAEFSQSVGKWASGDADERIQFGTIKIDGPLAMVWAPYQFFYKGKFSHCGVDVFQLVRFKDGWKIVYLIDTRRKSPCLSN